MELKANDGKNLEMKVIALDKNGSIDKLLIKVNQKEEDD